MKLSQNIWVNCDGLDDKGCPSNGVAQVSVPLSTVGEYYKVHFSMLKEQLQLIDWQSLKRPDPPFRRRCWVCPTCSRGIK